jgi:hypothetical protein
MLMILVLLRGIVSLWMKAKSRVSARTGLDWRLVLLLDLRYN